MKSVYFRLNSWVIQKDDKIRLKLLSYKKGIHFHLLFLFSKQVFNSKIIDLPILFPQQEKKFWSLFQKIVLINISTLEYLTKNQFEWNAIKILSSKMLLYDKDTLFLEALILDTNTRLKSELITSIKFSLAEIQSTKYTNESWIINHLILKP